MTCQENGLWDLNPLGLQCAPTCFLTVSHLDCGGCEREELFQELGVPNSTKCSLRCNAGHQVPQIHSLTCSHHGKWTSGKCEKTILLFAGGENGTGLLDSVTADYDDDTYASAFSMCLPSLPKRLKWGSMGLVKNSLIVCGGQEDELPNMNCWRLRPYHWSEISNLTR